MFNMRYYDIYYRYNRNSRKRKHVCVHTARAGTNGINWRAFKIHQIHQMEFIKFKSGSDVRIAMQFCHHDFAPDPERETCHSLGTTMPLAELY